MTVAEISSRRPVLGHPCLAFLKSVESFLLSLGLKVSYEHSGFSLGLWPGCFLALFWFSSGSVLVLSGPLVMLFPSSILVLF